MGGPSQPKKSPLIHATILFAVLLSGVVLTATYTDFSEVDLRGLLFLSALIACIFIAKNFYDVEAGREYAKEVEASFSDRLLFASKELYTELYHNSPIPYLIIDNEGKVHSANLAAVRLFDLKKGRLEGTSIFNRLASDEDDGLAIEREMFQRGVSISDELVSIKRADNSEIWALMSLFCFKSTTEPLGLLTLVDVTKQKQIERAKTEFVSLASHQLRTPLAAMKWSIELLELDGKDTLTPQQNKYIGRLLAGTKRLTLLIDDFLRVSRFELGTFQPEYSEVNLKDLIEEVLSEQSQRMEQKQLTAQTFFDETSSIVTSDQNLIRMILGNLVSNAVKYTKESGTIHVGYAKGEQSFTISVADNGMGIPPEDQERIFTKLFRASNAVRHVPEGTGLGLYIVKEAVCVLGGKVTFTSVPHLSTTFEVTLPLH